jgi:hypothetical protein
MVLHDLYTCKKESVECVEVGPFVVHAPGESTLGARCVSKSSTLVRRSWSSVGRVHCPRSQDGSPRGGYQMDVYFLAPLPSA